MPKRIIDGERTWRSQKLRRVQPESYRAEYLWLFALANDVASFECDPEIIHAMCYAAVRPSVMVEDVKLILAEFERVKLLYRWKIGDQIWGYWTGTEKPGLLPPPSQRYNKGPVPESKDLEVFLGGAYPKASETLEAPYSLVKKPLTGFGFGSGGRSMDLSISGEGSGEDQIKLTPEFWPEFDGEVLREEAVNGKS